MSSLLRPAGPLPPRVYWVRRLVVLAVVVAVLLIVFWAGLAIGGGGGTPKAGPSTGVSTSPSVSSSSHFSPSTSPSVSRSTSHSPSHSPSRSVSHSSSPSKSTSPASSNSSSSSQPAPQPCTDKAIAVTVSTDAKSYPSDVQPRLAMSVRNAGTVTCTRDVGQAALELRISTAAGVLVWSSDHCAPGGPHDIQTLQPNQVFRTAVVWSRTTSKPGCPTGQPKAGPGTYALTGRDLTVTSAGARFDLL